MPEKSPTSSINPVQQEAQWQEFVASQRGDEERPFEEHWAAFQKIFANRRIEDGPPVVWHPDGQTPELTNLYRAMEDNGFDEYNAFHRWSAEDTPAFWSYALRVLGIVFAREPDEILDLSCGVTHPRWLPGAEMNCVDSCFTAISHKPAIISSGEGQSGHRVISYGELERLVNRFANGLREQGIGTDTAIALYMPMTFQCVAAYLAIVRAGCRVVSIADSFSAAELRTRMDIVEAHIVLTVESYVRAGKTMTMYDRVVQAGVPRAIVIPARESDRPDLRESVILWDDLLSENDVFESVTGDPYRVINVLFSSGTTGEPKAIPWTNLTPLKGAMDGYFHQDIHSEDVVAWPTNIGWMMGPWLIYATFINRATMALYEGAPLDRGFTGFIRDAGVSILGVIPSIVRAWRTTGALDDTDWSRVRVITSTGEPSNREDYLWLMSRLAYRTPVIEYLGGTEIGGGHLTGTLLQPASPSTFTTPGLGMDFVILDEAGQLVNEGEMGELFIIPPAIGLSQALLNKDHDVVYYTDCPEGPNGETLRRHGDQALRMHRGFFRAQGRADDTMNLGGIKVSSLELEQIVDDHEAVYESAAVAVQAGGEGAEKLVVFVVLDSEIGHDHLSQDLRRMISIKLNPLFKIHDLVIADALPRTASNKLMRRTLRTQYVGTTS